MNGPSSDAERFDWLRLIRSENVGPDTFHTLLARFGSAGAALEALPDLAAAGGMRRSIRVATAGEVERELAAAERLGAHFVYFGTPAYPALLGEINGPPPVLAVRGDLSLAARPAVGIVGARQASAAGRTIAAQMAEAFGAEGITVVSGLALGIDAAAHRAALATGTVAVLAGGVDRPTPDENVALCEAIAEDGAAISEMPIGTEAFARLFVRRNRLIAGLSRAVVVVEAAARSGALHTANFAAAAGRDVFAVPGSPLDPRAAGCLKLLKEGAIIATEAWDVLQHLAHDVAEPMLPGFAEEEAVALEAPDGAHDRVRSALSMAPVPVDMVVRATGLAPAIVIATLMELELAGEAERELNGMVKLRLPDV